MSSNVRLSLHMGLLLYAIPGYTINSYQLEGTQSREILNHVNYINPSRSGLYWSHSLSAVLTTPVWYNVKVSFLSQWQYSCFSDTATLIFELHNKWRSRGCLVVCTDQVYHFVCRVRTKSVNKHTYEQTERHIHLKIATERLCVLHESY